MPAILARQATSINGCITGSRLGRSYFSGVVRRGHSLNARGDFSLRAASASGSFEGRGGEAKPFTRMN
jgi:hypothetical protein